MAARAADGGGEGGAPGRRRLLRVEKADAGRALLKVASGLLGLFLFVLALQIMKDAARPLGELVDLESRLGTPLRALGFGWILSYVVMSGSPVAAVSLTFFAGGVIDELQTFTMIAGSRFGASFVVLLLGFLYALRGKAKGQSLEMGVLSLLTTYAIYGIAVPVGLALLASGALDAFHPTLPRALFDFIEVVYTPIVAFLGGFLHPALLFALGVGVILLAFALFDAALPDLSKESPVHGLEAHVFRPTVMFALGCVITLFTLSVSVSLGLLVPLSAKGIARRENVIPYIMGANITTFVDTLFATLFLDRPGAFTIVLVEMTSVAVVSLAALFLFYRQFERLLLALSSRILRTRARLGVFLILILIVPLMLLLI